MTSPKSCGQKMLTVEIDCGFFPVWWLLVFFSPSFGTLKSVVLTDLGGQSAYWPEGLMSGNGDVALAQLWFGDSVILGGGGHAVFWAQSHILSHARQAPLTPEFSPHPC